MSKVLKVVASVASIAAMIPGPHQPIAAAVAVVASVGSQITATKPPARGSETQIRIEVDPPQPYIIGRVYHGGVMRHDAAYGGSVNKVKNPYRGMVVVYSGAGPVQSITPQVDYAAVSSWYSGFLYTDTQLGLKPEAASLSPNWAGFPGWGATSLLSGQAAILWNFRFDKKGKRFASGIPPFGAIVEGVKVYDPRLDSTYPGGAGTHRIADETTWTYSANPALHAIAYTYGRHQNGKKVFGIGLPAESIDMARMVAWANVCDANTWAVSGVIQEPGDRWNNLKDIMVAGAAEPVFANGVLSVRYRAPLVALDTIAEDDLADDDMSKAGMQSYRNRLNGIVPKYRSEAHNWEYVSSETVSVAAYVTEDGEAKVEEQQYNLVVNKDQAAQLAGYDLVDGREVGPITLHLKPQWRGYKPGECLHLTLPSLGLDDDAIILSREIDPGTMTVVLTLVTEDPAKHALALGQIGTAAPLPTAGNAQERDETVGEAIIDPAEDIIYDGGTASTV